MTKKNHFTSSDAPTFSARLYPGEVKKIDELISKLGYRGRGTFLRAVSAGEILVFVACADTSGEMRDQAKRIRELLGVIQTSDWDALNQTLNGLAAALENAASLKAELECDDND